MSLTLGAELSAAMDGISRRPLVEITSESPIPDIPFLGTELTSESTDESSPSVKSTADGRLVLSYIYGGSLRYSYTDTERTEYSHIGLTTADTVTYVSTLILADGNIGIVYCAYDGSGQYIRSQVLSPTGAVITGETTIETWAAADLLCGADVIYLASGSYLMMYGLSDSGTGTFLKKNTSADFITWAGSSTVTPSGINNSPGRYKRNLYLVQINTGEVFAFFDYVESVSASLELVNIYLTISTNDGVSWGAIQKVSTYTDYAATGHDPSITQKAIGEMTVAYHEKRASLTMGSTDPGLPAFPTYSSPWNPSIDHATRKLYLTNEYAWVGDFIRSIVKVDIDTWTVDKYWTDITVPAIPAHYMSGIASKANTHGDGKYVPVVAADSKRIMVLNGDADTITEYDFNTATTNISNLPSPLGGAYHLKVEALENRMYIHFVTNTTSRFGYIDLTETGSTYTWTELWYITTGLWSETEILFAFNAFHLNLANDLMIVGSGVSTSNWKGMICVFQVSTGTLLKKYHIDTFSGFPYRGVHSVYYKDGYIYASAKYDATYDPGHKGVIKVNLTTDVIQYLLPTYDTLDDYLIYQWSETDEGLLIASSYYGFVTHDTVTGVWAIINNTTVPGWSPRNNYGDSSCWGVAYDHAKRLAFASSVSQPTLGPWVGVLYFPIEGTINIGKVQDGTGSGSSWSFGAATDFTQGNFSSGMSIIKDPDPAASGLYAYWTSESAEEFSLRWGLDGSSKIVSDFLVDGSTISVKRSIDGKPNRLEFAVSQGHLFDPHNLASLWSIYMKKNRRMIVRWGESVSGAPYWQNAGTFIVRETRAHYEQGSHPTLDVVAEDVRTWWEDAEISTQYYTATPESILADIIETYGGILASDIIISTMTGTYVIWQQWVDRTIKEIVEEICNRFGYFPRITVDNDFEVGVISASRPTDHVYGDLTKIQGFTPDDSFSDYTNRVVVVGESRGFLEVTFPEEQIDTIGGTGGWFDGQKNFTVWYSKDKTRTCRDPRLEVIQSIKEFGWKLGGGGESISFTDPDEKYCIVTVNFPNLTGALLGACAAIVAAAAVMGASSWNPFSGGATGAGLGAAIVVAIYILASVATYQYAIYAKPLGEERQMFQGEANDYEAQAEIGRVVVRKFEDSLCIDQSQCQAVATYELSIAQMQRNRLRLSKIAHLADEEGDVIEVNHPYSNQTMRIFITDIERRMVLGASFMDEIEGWRV